MRRSTGVVQVLDATQSDLWTEILGQVVGSLKKKEERKNGKKRRKEKTSPTSLVDLDLCKLRHSSFQLRSLCDLDPFTTKD
jgi:hypothetical protein